MEKLLPDQLKEIWQLVDQGQVTIEEFNSRQDLLLAEYRNTWTTALVLEGFPDLQGSILRELSVYLNCQDLEEVRSLCVGALSSLRTEWAARVQNADKQSVEKYYNESQGIICELMWWHTLLEDATPLAYVVALEFAKQRGCKNYLDFGSGVGAGGILFARHHLEVTLADISSTMLSFTEWRFDLRGLPGRFVDLKLARLHDNAFDIVTAMDVFEHLVDPVTTLDELARTIRPGGFLFARFHAEADEERPQHIVTDFGPTLKRLDELQFVEIWRDEWLWGHQIFQKH